MCNIGEGVRKEVKNEKSENKQLEIQEILIRVTCPKCGQEYIASDGHECPKEK